MSTSFNNKKVSYLNVSPLAARKIQELIESNQEKNEGIRITLKTKGCSGLEYDIQYAQYPHESTLGNIKKTDDIVEISGQDGKIFKVFIDSKFSLYIIGTLLDYEESDTEEGFKFINPNEKGRCGCGESFTV